MANESEYGAYLPTTKVFDTKLLKQMEQKLGPEAADFFSRLQQGLNNIALNSNVKQSGFMLPTEFLNGRQYAPNSSTTGPSAQTTQFRPAYSVTIDTGALPVATTKNVAHGIDFDTEYTLTALWGAATDPNTTYIPLPFIGASATNNVAVQANTTNIVITTSSNMSNFSRSFVTLEYIKS